MFENFLKKVKNTIVDKFNKENENEFEDKSTKENTKKELPSDFMDYLYVIFASQCVGRTPKDLNYKLSTIDSSYIKNPKVLFEQMTRKKSLVEMNATDKLSVLTVKELKGKFNFTKKIKRDIINEITQNYSYDEIENKIPTRYYKLSKEYKQKLQELELEYSKNSDIFYNLVIENIKNFDFDSIFDVELKRLPSRNDLFDNVYGMPTISFEPKKYYLKRLKIYNSFNIKKYISNEDEYIENFKYYYFATLIDSKNSDRYFLYFLNGKYPNLDYEYYNEKYFKYKRNIEKQIFEQFRIFLNSKIANKIYSNELKKNYMLNYREIVYKLNCLVHENIDEERLKPENINEEIFCTCHLSFESEFTK